MSYHHYERDIVKCVLYSSLQSRNESSFSLFVYLLTEGKGKEPIWIFKKCVVSLIYVRNMCTVLENKHMHTYAHAASVNSVLECMESRRR